MRQAYRSFEDFEHEDFRVGASFGEILDDFFLDDLDVEGGRGRCQKGEEEQDDE